MSICTFFVRACESPPNLEELKTKISSGSIDEKISGLKDLIKCIVND